MSYFKLKKIEKRFLQIKKRIKNKLAGFTLVELIITIVILSILAVLAYISFLGFARDTRDSARIANLNMMKLAINVFDLREGRYPKPTNALDVSYSGAKLWSQGTFGDELFINVKTVNKKPTDVLSKNDFSYSLLNTNREFQLGIAIEGSLKINNNVISSANALNNIEARIYTTGNYNGKVLKAFSGTTLYVISMPTITVNNLDDLDIVKIVDEKRLSYKGYKNLPESYSGTVFKVDGGFDFDPNFLVIYAGDLEDLLYSETEQINLLKKLQDSYSGTILATNPAFVDLIDLEIDTNIASKDVRELAYELVEETLKLEQPIELTSGSDWITYVIENVLLDDDTRSITQDLLGNIWFATKKGVNVFGEGLWLGYDESDGLADKDTRNVLADINGDIWFATNKGVSVFDGTTWTTYDKLDGLSSDDVMDIYEASDGTLWFATNKGVTVYDGTNFVVYDQLNGLIDNEVKSIGQSNDGLMWFATMQGISSFDGSNWVSYNHLDGLADKDVLSLYADINGDMWFGTINGVSSFDGTTFTNYNLVDGLVDKFVQSIFQDSDGTMWFGTKRGANSFDGTTWDLFDTTDGLADNDVQVIFEDEAGNMWFGTKKGVTIYFK